MNKPTCEQLIEQLGDKQDITICSDVVYGLGYEYQQLKNEVNKLNNKIKDIKDYVNFLVIINQTINGKFSETQWGKDILDLIGDNDD